MAVVRAKLEEFAPGAAGLNKLMGKESLKQRLAKLKSAKKLKTAVGSKLAANKKEFVMKASSHKWTGMKR